MCWSTQTKKMCKFSSYLGQTMHRTFQKMLHSYFFFLYTNIKLQHGKDIKKNRDQPPKHLHFKIKIICILLSTLNASVVFYCIANRVLHLIKNPTEIKKTKKTSATWPSWCCLPHKVWFVLCFSSQKEQGLSRTSSVLICGYLASLVILFHISKSIPAQLLKIKITLLTLSYQFFRAFWSLNFMHSSF